MPSEPALLVLPAELTHRAASACLGMLRQGVKAQQGKAVVVDANLLERFDSSAIAVLLACRRECIDSGRSFSVRALPPRLRELAGLYGVDDLLPAAALASASGDGPVGGGSSATA